MGGVPFDHGLRIETGDWPEAARPDAASAPVRVAHLPLTDIAPWPGNMQRKVLTPSDLGGAKALPGEAFAVDQIRATERGEAVHLLLQHLPGYPEASWPNLTDHLIANPALREPALDEARGVLLEAAHARLFGPESFSEVGVTSDFGTDRLFGVIDRLILSQDLVLAVDFKSNAVIPSGPEQVPEGLLRQLGAYHHILDRLYPDRRVEVAILWTRTGLLMPVDAEIVSAALQRATRDGISSP